MRLVIQCVKEASVKVENKLISSIGPGMLTLIGLHENDTAEIVTELIEKMLKLRIFSDENGKTNLALSDIQGELLLISQFTLYGDCSKSRRPSFTSAKKPDEALALYNLANDHAKKILGESRVKNGKFGSYMEVSLINDGPSTYLLDRAL